MAAIENLRGERAHEPNIMVGIAEPEEPLQAEHPLDSLDNRRLHAQLLDWLYTSVDMEFDNRLQQQLDYDFYDHIQWSEEDRAVLAARHQAPLTYNKIKMALDWILGTERRTRIDGVVHPRTEDDVPVAEVKSELLKYLSDTNRLPWERSLAFKDAAIAGVGWTEETVRTDRTDEPLMVKHVPWKQMRRDPFSRALDLQDCRYLIREKFVDVDYGCAIAPTRAHLVLQCARDHLFPDDFGEQEFDIPQLYRTYDSRGYEISGRRITGRSAIEAKSRLRVKMFECWFRKPVATKRIWGGGFYGDAYNPEAEQFAEAAKSLQGGETVYSLTDAVTEEMWCAIFTEAGLLQLQKSPFKHGQFPFTPYWCYRRDRDGMPYGVVRGIRDSQEDLNKRMSKLLWALSTNQLFYEDDAIDEDLVEHTRQELAKPNGVIKLKTGGLAKIKVERNLDVAEAQIKLLELDAAHIHDGSGVNRELLGRETNAASGRAIIAKQNEGSVTTAELFDNYRLGHQLSGEKQLSITEQFMTQERQFRIVGDSKDVRWLKINQWKMNTGTGAWYFENDITSTQADFVVDQQDFRESMRQAYAEKFFELLGKLPPEFAMQLIDLAFEMTDMPRKDDVIARIRKITRQTEDGEATPEAKAEQEAQAREQELQLRERMAKVGLDEAKAKDLLARAKNSSLQGRKESLLLMEILDVLAPLAPAADRLYTGTPPTEEPANVAA